jgi:hypothetical protein
VVLFALTAQPQPAASQGRLLDGATLLVTRGSNIVGREEFQLRQGQLSEANTVMTGVGYTVSATAFYPSSRSYASASSMIRFGADSQPTGAQMDLDGSGQPNAFVDFTARRITVRNRTSAGESAGQYPRPGRILLMDESLLSVFALLPGTTPGSVTLFYPRTGRTNQASLTDLGTEATTIDSDERELRHLTLGSADRVWHLWYDSRGRLIKIEVPTDDLTATRSSRN